MDEELKTFLVGMETRLTSQVVTSEARTEERIKGFEVQLKGFEVQLKGFEVQLKGFEEQLKASEGRMVEQIRDSETRLVGEFWKWGRTSDQRMRRMESSDATTVERMSALEDRVFTLERKVAGSPE